MTPTRLPGIDTPNDTVWHFGEERAWTATIWLDRYGHLQIVIRRPDGTTAVRWLSPEEQQQFVLKALERIQGKPRGKEERDLEWVLRRE